MKGKFFLLYYSGNDVFDYSHIHLETIPEAAQTAMRPQLPNLAFLRLSLCISDERGRLSEADRSGTAGLSARQYDVH